jgi:predicted metalloprotease
MKWQGRRGSSNIQDRRRSGATSAGGIGGVGAILLLLAGWYFGVDVSGLIDPGGGIGGTRSAEVTQEDEQAAAFVSVTLADTEEVWAGIFRDRLGETYRKPTLVLFKGGTNSACGGANAASGPFYCPGDRMIYLDTDFFVTLERRLGAGGDFAAAYVVAHEVAHSVQDQLGILGDANQARASAGGTRSNAISVQIELQADCFSGVWARAAEARFGSLDRGDIAEAMNAAKQIGDDTLQRSAGQRVQPHTFTHGTSEQRQRWFARGYDSGDILQCDTFSARQL